jgi:uncharacterized protein YgiM (DUF1202 family)
VSDKLASTLRVRTQPTTESDVVGLLVMGEQVRILGGPLNGSM